MGKVRGLNRESIVHRSFDKFVGRQWKVLDDGFVRVVDYLGSDRAIVQAARISYGQGTKTPSADASLIRYLMRHRHTTPFEMCEIKLHVRVPMDIWRQWIRHRTASVNEYSTRYSIAINATSRVSPEEWRSQSTSNRQGSDGQLEASLGRRLTKQQDSLLRASRHTYDVRVRAGVAREQARKDLPLSTYTEAYWKIDLHNLLHFLALRLDSHAQFEIREYANVIGYQIVANWCPAAWQAFVDYTLGSISLSRQETEYIRTLVQSGHGAAQKAAASLGWVRRVRGSFTLSREGREVGEKLSRLGFSQALHEEIADKKNQPKASKLRGSPPRL